MFKYVDLGARNTPLQFNSAFSDFLGVPFFIKRDDMCGSKLGLNGSDARKIEFLVQAIAVEQPDVIVIVGHFRSNFTRMFVQAVANLVSCHVVYIDEFSQPVSFNLAAVQICGAQTHGQQDIGYANTLINTLSESGKKVFVVRPGGTQTVAAMGGYALFDEVAVQLLAEHEMDAAAIYVSSDSGVTQAGMLSASGVRKQHIPHSLVTIGVPFCKTLEIQSSLVAENYATLGALCSSPEELDETQALNVELSILLSDSHYLPEPDMALPNSFVSLATLFYQHTSLLVDYVYGLPVLSALVADVKEGRITSPVVFINPVSPVVPFLTY